MSKRKKPPVIHTIVLARLNKERLFNHYADFTAKPSAMVWLREGTEEDVAKAEAYAAKAGYKVFLYPPTDPDPLEHGRHDLLDTFLQPRQYVS